MPYASSLTDKEWDIPKRHYCPKRSRLLRLVGLKDKFTNGIFYQLKNGCNWWDLPSDLPPYKDSLLAFLAVALGGSSRPNYGNPPCQSAATGQEKQKWTRLLIIDFACSEEYL